MIKINDSGFYLGYKKYEENSGIIFILSKKNGLIKSFTKFSKKNTKSFMILDEIDFTWKSKQSGGLGYVNIDLKKSNYFESHYLHTLIKSSAGELCLNFLPLWQSNVLTYNDITNLKKVTNDKPKAMILKYVWWEVFFLKNNGYGLNLNKCAVTGSKDDIYYLSPKSGNSVSYSEGKKFHNKLFVIPECLKSSSINFNYSDFQEALKITGYFLNKNFESNLAKLIFRNQLIEKIISFEK